MGPRVEQVGLYELADGVGVCGFWGKLGIWGVWVFWGD